MRASHFFSICISSLVASNVGCSSSNGPGSAGSSYDSMFDAPASNATPDRVTGLWGGSVEQGGVRFDFRVRVEDARMTVASRCKWQDGLVLSVGAAAASRITQKPDGDISCFPIDPPTKSECGDVQLLESQSDRATSGDRWCAVDLHPQAYEWTMSGSKLRFTLSGQQVDLVKVSD